MTSCLRSPPRSIACRSTVMSAPPLGSGCTDAVPATIRPPSPLRRTMWADLAVATPRCTGPPARPPPPPPAPPPLGAAAPGPPAPPRHVDDVDQVLRHHQGLAAAQHNVRRSVPRQDPLQIDGSRRLPRPPRASLLEGGHLSKP